MEGIHVLIADDHPIVRKGLRVLIGAQRDMEVVGEAADGLETVQKARQLSPDVVLLDLVMPRMDGIAAIHEVLRESPKVRILVLTSYPDDRRIMNAIKAGALGYLLKDSSPRDLLAAIREVARGEACLPSAIARKLIKEYARPRSAPIASEEPLSERELEVLVLIGKGLSNREIADALVISERTVHGHVSHVLQKLHLPSRTQAALHALREGLVEPNCA